MSRFEKSLNMFLDPVSVFEQLREKKDWVFPLVVIFVIAILTIVSLIPVLSSPEYIAEIEQEIGEAVDEEMESYMMIGAVVGSVGSAIFSLLSYLLLGFFLWLIGKFAAREYPFSHTFS